MKTIGTYKIKVSSTFDKKKLKNGTKRYEYGSISMRSPELAKYIGKTVKVKIEMV